MAESLADAFQQALQDGQGDHHPGHPPEVGTDQLAAAPEGAPCAEALHLDDRSDQDEPGHEDESGDDQGEEPEDDDHDEGQVGHDQGPVGKRPGDLGEPAPRSRGALLLAGRHDAGIEDGAEQRDRRLADEDEGEDGRPAAAPVVERVAVERVEGADQADRGEDDDPGDEQQSPVEAIAAGDPCQQRPDRELRRAGLRLLVWSRARSHRARLRFRPPPRLVRGPDAEGGFRLGRGRWSSYCTAIGTRRPWFRTFHANR